MRSSVNRLLRPIALTAFLAVVLAIPAGADAQESVESTILLDPQTDELELIYDGIADELVAISPSFQKAIDRSNGWTRAWWGDVSGLEITAYQMASIAELEGLLVGSISDIAGQSPRRLPDHDGVLAWTETLEGQPLQIRFFAEGTSAYWLSAIGPDSEGILERALNAQLSLATGDRYPITVDLADDLAGTGGIDWSPWMGYWGARALLLIVLYGGGKRFTRRKAKAKAEESPVVLTPTPPAQEDTPLRWDPLDYQADPLPPSAVAATLPPPRPTTRTPQPASLPADPFGV